MKERKWNARIQRARDLEKTYPFATEGLRFYQRVAEAQETLYCELVSRKDNSGHRYLEDNFRQELDFPFLLPRLQRFLLLVEESAPAALAHSARDIRSKNGDHSKEMLTRFWVGGSFSEEDLDPVGSLLSWAFLQPYAEYLADQRKAETMDGTPSTCPLCGSNPIVGVLRREGDGARKSLVCMLCAHEWAFRRVYCASCGEEREPQMAFYSAPEIPHVRVDVCDTCHTYLKSVDLTKMGLAVPVVDELATIPLDLWARQHGYHKLQSNLLGM
jgi:formate dehydrogenase accessory protein FdhE